MARKRNQTKGKPETASKSTTHNFYRAPAVSVDPELTNYYSTTFNTLFEMYKCDGYDNATAYNSANTYAAQFLNMYLQQKVFTMAKDPAETAAPANAPPAANTVASQALAMTIQPDVLASLGRPRVMTQPSAMDMNGVPVPSKTAAVAAPAAAPEAAPPAITASTALRASLPVPPTSSGVTILPAAKRTLSTTTQDSKALDRASMRAAAADAAEARAVAASASAAAAAVSPAKDAATPARASASAPAEAQDQAEAEASASPRAPSPVTMTHHERGPQERLSDRADTASGTIACPPAQLSYVEANRSCLQRELGVGLRVSEAAAPGEITISAPSAHALEVARVELEAMLHTADDDESPHPLRVKIEALKRENVHVFVDNSNVYLGAQTTSRRLTAVDGGGPPLSTNNNPRDLSVRLKVGALSRAVINSRCCQTRIVFGAKPSAGSFVWKKWQDAGFTVQAVDAGGLLFSTIDATITQYAEQAHTLVLVTGDGNAYDGHRVSFVKSAEKALRHGWKVEVWAWQGCTSDKYRAMEQVHAAACGRFSLNSLDPFRAYITFQQPLGGVAVVVDEGTSATPDDDESCLRSKPSVEPRGSPSRPTRPTDGQRVHPVAVAVAVAAPTVDDEDEDEDEDEDGHRRRRRSDRDRCRTRWSQAQR